MHNERRGMALVLVLVVIVVLFFLGVTVAGLSTNNARIVMHVEEGALARQAALAAKTQAEVTLNAAPDWTQSLSGLTASRTERAIVGSDPPTWCSVQLLGTPTTESAVVQCEGYLKNADGSPRSVVSMVVRFQRSTGAFLYPMQASGAVTVGNGSTITVDDDVAIRTNATTTGSVQVDGSSKVSGDVMVGPTPNPAGIVVPASLPVTSAPGAVPMQPVVAPGLSPGVMVQSPPK